MTNLDYVLYQDSNECWASKAAKEHRLREAEEKREQDLRVWHTYLDSEG